MRTKEKCFQAKTIEEAKMLAAQEFDVALEEIEFEVIEQPKKGIFGIAKADAKVKATYTLGKAEIAANYIRTILDKMNIENASVEITYVDGGAVLDIVSDGMGVIIGRRGETLDALQYLASLACNKGDSEYFRITVDSCGYREKRKKTLEDLANKIAKKVAKTGRTSTLEPMNPYERRIIHSSVANVEGVTSRSQGEDPYRKVIIRSTNKKPRYNKDNRDRRGGRKPRPQKQSSDVFMTSFEKEYQRKKAPEITADDKNEKNYDVGLFEKLDI